MFGLAAEKNKTGNTEPKQLEINFSPEFEGL
jgi:hypothetical protein